MRDVIEILNKKLSLSKEKERTEWRDGYETALAETIEVVNNGIDKLIIPGKTYFVIMYHNGDKFFPYVEEMRLYKISEKKRKSYCFSRNLNASLFNTSNPDLVLSSEKGLRERVFFTREKAEEAIAI